MENDTTNLVVTRKSGQGVWIGTDVFVRVILDPEKGRQAKLSISAPRHVEIYREEIKQKKEVAE